MYVTATNSVGPGQERTTTATPNAVPDQVTGLATNPGDGTVTLTWQPAADAAAPPTGYEVEVSPPPSGGAAVTNVGVRHVAHVHRPHQRHRTRSRHGASTPHGSAPLVARRHRDSPSASR